MNLLKKWNKKGFTLVELLMVAIIFPLLILTTYSVLEMAGVIFRSDTVYSQLNQSSMQVLRHVTREVSQTSPLASPSHLNITLDGQGQSVLRFQVPVDWDNDGDAVQGTNSNVVEWGAYNQSGDTQNGVLDGWVQYSVTNGQLIRDVLTSGLVVIQGNSKVISDNVTLFSTIQNNDRIQLNLTVQRSDTVGQGGTARPVQQIFSQEVLMRNSVN